MKLALDNYTKEEIRVIDKFLGDGAVWRGIGRDRPATSFKDLETLTKNRESEASAVKDRMEREKEVLNTYSDGSGHIGGRLTVYVQQIVQSLVRTGIGSTTVYANERDFQRYTEMLRAVCEILKGW